MPGGTNPYDFQLTPRHDAYSQVRKNTRNTLTHDKLNLQNLHLIHNRPTFMIKILLNHEEFIIRNIRNYLKQVFLIPKPVFLGY